MGHVAPMLATAKALKELVEQAEIICLGTENGLEAEAVPAAGYRLETIAKVAFPRRLNKAALAFPFAFSKTMREVKELVRKEEIAAVVGFGGFVCPPAYLAARSQRLPLIIHEANKKPGLANRLGAKYASGVFTAFEPDVKGTLKGAKRIGMPLNQEISQLKITPESKAAAKESLGLDPHKPTLLVTGGSLGAVRLNQELVKALPELAQLGVQTVHITGKGKKLETQAPNYLQLEYVTQMAQVYAAADFAVTRSGAGTVSELSAIGLPALYVPLPIGNGEQALNGQDVVAAGGALMIADSQLSAQKLVQVVSETLLDPQQLSQMAAAAAGFGIKDAAHRLAQAILDSLENQGFAD